VRIAQGGAQAFTLLTDLLAGKPVEPTPVQQDSQLIVRGSTAPPSSTPREE
jgi:DNA-binding LacI/PurR family transcriptional regulator